MAKIINIKYVQVNIVKAQENNIIEDEEDDIK